MSVHSVSAITVKPQSTPPPRNLEMLSATSRTTSHLLSFPKTTSSSFLRHHFKPICSTHPQTQTQTRTKMSSSSTTPPSSFIEHIVLFKARPDADPSKINSMLTNLNNLVSLQPVLHLSAGPIHHHRSSTLTFTHILHSRYLTKPDLDTYSQHPSHVSVVSDYVAPVVSDVMAVDWVANDASGSLTLPPGSAFRLKFIKLKENAGEAEKEKVLGVIGARKEKFEGVQFTLGENFSPGRAKGFSIASISVFKGVNELEALEGEMDEVRELVEDVLEVDYVVPGSQVASL